MAVKDCEEGVSITQVQFVDTGILHSLTPACVGNIVPCISEEAKENLVSEAY